MITTLKTTKHTVTYNNGIVASVRDNVTGRFVKVALYVAETPHHKTTLDAVNMDEIYAMWKRVGEQKRAKHHAEVEAMYARETAMKEAKKANSIWAKFKNLLTTPLPF